MKTRDGRYRKNVKPGLQVNVVLLDNQRTGKLTYGVVQEVLTDSDNHAWGIEVRLENGAVGRVKEIIQDVAVAV